MKKAGISLLFSWAVFFVGCSSSYEPSITANQKSGQKVYTINNKLVLASKKNNSEVNVWVNQHPFYPAAGALFSVQTKVPKSQKFSLDNIRVFQDGKAVEIPSKIEVMKSIANASKGELNKAKVMAVLAGMSAPTPQYSTSTFRTNNGSSGVVQTTSYDYAGAAQTAASNQSFVVSEYHKKRRRIETVRAHVEKFYLSETKSAPKEAIEGIFAPKLKKRKSKINIEVNVGDEIHSFEFVIL
ncbi:hypothetical protein OAG12_01890 [Akkermansiaceae bacterium]|nr:hypothetical protein [Akkermansiaceae bacterium]